MESVLIRFSPQIKRYHTLSASDIADFPCTDLFFQLLSPPSQAPVQHTCRRECCHAVVPAGREGYGPMHSLNCCILGTEKNPCLVFGATYLEVFREFQ